MTLKNWMSAKAIICVLFGLGFVLLPDALLSLYGSTLGEGGIYMTRLVGAGFILLTLLLWLNRNASEPATRRSFALAVFVGDAIGFVVTLMGQLNGVMNALGWATVAIYLVLALGFGYFLIAG